MSATIKTNQSKRAIAKRDLSNHKAKHINQNHPKCKHCMVRRNGEK